MDQNWAYCLDIGGLKNHLGGTPNTAFLTLLLLELYAECVYECVCVSVRAVCPANVLQPTQTTGLTEVVKCITLLYFSLY